MFFQSGAKVLKKKAQDIFILAPFLNPAAAVEADGSLSG
jgi:hypothetical protein